MLIPFENILGDNIRSNMRHIMEPIMIQIRKMIYNIFKMLLSRASVVHKFVNKSKIKTK